jgi:EAL domain-containing protein (putative c-di-GMP-specific phosphodiesterase class I)
MTIMEAVETAEDAEALHDLGIDYAQGYYFLKPLPGRELAQILHGGALRPARIVPPSALRAASSAS